ncbi:MAG: Uma2 family endonuclease, partial [Saprospiraceae bacterium]|nr:Uma2 family endonuclease [Saprospiraceae bacterium]
KNHQYMAVESPILEKTYTVEEYFELEKHSEIRHEYYYGKLLLKSGGSKKENRIAGNCEFQLRLQLRKKGLDFFRHDVRMLVREQKIYRYPDFVIAPVVDDSDSHLIKQSVLVIEVSSDNSDHTDRVTKRNEYLNLPTLQYYLIISQSERLINMYSRDEKGWRFDSFSKEEEVIEFTSLGAKLSLSDIYDEVEFSI